MWGEKEHGVFPEPLSGVWVWVCAGWGSSLEMGAGEVGGNQMTMTSKALGRRLCFLQLVLEEKSLKLGNKRIRFVFS